MDGKFHEIKVRVKQPGLEVRSRAGYWAPRAADVARAKAATDTAVLPPAVKSALAKLPPRTAPNAVEIWTGTAPLAGGLARVTVAWTPRDPASDTGGDTQPAPAEVTVTAAPASGQIVDRRVDPAGTSFEAAPGSLKMSFTVRDKAGEVIDRVVRVVEVPDSSAPALGLTTPVVYRVKNPSDMRAVMSESPPVYAGRDFLRTDRLMVRFATYRAIEGGRVSATLLSRAGVKLVDLPAAADPARSGYTDRSAAVLDRARRGTSCRSRPAVRANAPRRWSRSECCAEPFPAPSLPASRSPNLEVGQSWTSAFPLVEKAFASCISCDFVRIEAQTETGCGRNGEHPFGIQAPAADSDGVDERRSGQVFHQVGVCEMPTPTAGRRRDRRPYSIRGG